MYIRKILVAFLFVTFISELHAQSLSDGLRLSAPTLGSGARTEAMGGAGIASVNDYSALDWNPAALIRIESAELNLGMLYLGHNSSAQFLGTTTTSDLSQTTLNSFALASNVPTSRGHLAFGISIDRTRDFNSTYTFSAVNPNSSLFDTKDFVNDPGIGADGTFANYLTDLQYNNLAWQLYLTNGFDSTNPKLTTPFAKGGMLQTGTVTTSGGQYAVRLGAGIDVAPNISLGATLNYISGVYDYNRTYTESDINNVFSRTDSTPPDGFRSATIYDNLHETQNGFNIKLGLLATTGKFLSLGFTAETPTWYSIDASFQRTGTSQFNYNKSFSSIDLDPDIVESLNPVIMNSYNLTTPWKFGAGASVSLLGLTVSAAAGYEDYSTIRYSDAAADLSDLNDAAQQNLRAVINYKLGAEFVFKPIGVMLRGGYALDPSPYKNDPSSYNTQSLTGGFGILLGPAAILEATYRRVTYRTDHLVYGGMNLAGTDVTTAINADDIVQNQVLLSLSFRW